MMMEYTIKSLEIENFKSFSKSQKINISDLSVLLGANSSGKSTAIQALLVLKQTMECNSSDIELLLSGKYVALGSFEGVLYNKKKKEFTIGIDFECRAKSEITNPSDVYNIKWHIHEATEDKQNAVLSQIEINYADKSILLERISLNRYQLFYNQKIYPIIIQVNNLILSDKILIEYDKELNKLFAQFIDSIKELIDGKKINKVATDKLVSINLTQSFYMWMLGHEDIVHSRSKKMEKDIKELAESITNLISEYNTSLTPFPIDYLGFTEELETILLYSFLIKSENKDSFKKLYKNYKFKLDSYRNKNIGIEKYEGVENVNRYLFTHFTDVSNNIVDTVGWISDFYKDFQETLKNLFFIGPIRENPQGLYNLEFEQVPKYVGPSGAFFASVLMHEKKTKKYILPYGEEETNLLEALNEWTSHLDIASAIEAKRATSYGIMVSVSDTQNKTADIINVGIGTSQVLPVLIAGLLSEEGETLVFEQPELHLHPFSQSRLADFFVALIKYGRKILVETHSETLLLRLRYHVLKENCSSNSININFFENNNGTKVSMCNISERGNIEYPKGFKDETQELINDLLKVVLIKDKK